MKKQLLIIASFVACTTYASAQFIYNSEEKTADGLPKIANVLETRLRLNAYANLGGTDPGSQSISLLSANPYAGKRGIGVGGNMYQSQIANTTTYNGLPGGPLKVYIEAHYWGGPGAGGNLQLRQAYVQYYHFKVGQAWTMFGGDVPSWYNTVDWEASNSGMWSRHLQFKYFTEFGPNKSWGFEAGAEMSMGNLNIASGGSGTTQVTPDPIVAVTHKVGNTDLRLAAIFRGVRGTNGANKNQLAAGYGANFIFKSMLGKKTYLMGELMSGSGIESYSLSGEYFGGNNTGNGSTAGGTMYDAIVGTNGKIQTVPMHGLNLGTEIFWGKNDKFHSNIVAGYTSMRYNNNFANLQAQGVISVATDPASAGAQAIINANSNATTTKSLYFGSLNTWYDILDHWSIGLEYNYGLVNITNATSKSVSVNRIALAMTVGF